MRQMARNTKAEQMARAAAEAAVESERVAALGSVTTESVLSLDLGTVHVHSLAEATDLSTKAAVAFTGIARTACQDLCKAKAFVGRVWLDAYDALVDVEKRTPRAARTVTIVAKDLGITKDNVQTVVGWAWSSWQQCLDLARYGNLDAVLDDITTNGDEGDMTVAKVVEGCRRAAADPTKATVSNRKAGAEADRLAREAKGERLVSFVAGHVDDVTDPAEVKAFTEATEGSLLTYSQCATASVEALEATLVVVKAALVLAKDRAAEARKAKAEAKASNVIAAEADKQSAKAAEAKVAATLPPPQMLGVDAIVANAVKAALAAAGVAS